MRAIMFLSNLLLLLQSSSVADATETARAMQIVTFEPCREPEPNAVYFCPMTRYCSWSSYSVKTRTRLRESIGYVRRDWNFESLVLRKSVFTVEQTNFEDLNSTVQAGLGILGFDEDAHDCCQVHYDQYAWDDFASDDEFGDTMAALVALGYDKDAWDIGWKTPYENFNWDELPENIQLAAEELCFNRELWDGIKLPWLNADYLPGQYYTETDPPTGYPTSSPVVVNSTSVTTTNDLPPLEMNSTLVQPSGTCPVLDTNILNWCPTRRYCEWDSFNLEEKKYLKDASGYTRREWNYVRENPYESIRFSNLNSTAQAAYTFLGYNEETHDCCNGHFKGFAWSDFDISKGYGDVLAALEMLGFTEAIWSNYDLDTMYNFNQVTWDELPASARSAAASTLCYSRELWNRQMLPWPANATLPNGKSIVPPQATDQPTSGLTQAPSPSPTKHLSVKPSSHLSSPPSISSPLLPTEQPAKPTSSPTEAPTTSPTVKLSASPTTKLTASPVVSTDTPSIDPNNPARCREVDPEIYHWCPYQRYCEWDFYLPPDREVMRSRIGYSRTDWNYEVVNPIELSRFSSLEPRKQNGMIVLLGFDEDTHDCCQNHYEDYSWEEFNADGFEDVLEALGTLGYTREIWNNGAAPANERLNWDDLPVERQVAAKELCWTRETWDQVELTEWPIDAELPGTTSIEFKPSVIPGNDDTPVVLLEDDDIDQRDGLNQIITQYSPSSIRHPLSKSLLFVSFGFLSFCLVL